ncbi:MAG: hypothetical protein UV61_C0006G0102 [Candidatus Gottesmanbacteria bacterium GW2011_GWB1_43_11]|uniref:Uncharacterized protein n=1 Tax=Candidatus Gottesmanbacteria bacterium GW2011_GWB1_43_11 TaxID=1618446 RepID=A0A0G1EV41_9BACT|nr:MAG: hypothetical protein UV04_C0005G0101 [Candidatus Gottesmanbacteria bacterium GW2011_GWA2_42_16]KKS55713.1 MAG: hypothetical protein UV17_C0008G0064 [Candidatus Gottesmanbacteria bacterium GW2011_GWA1_42_26]KKS81169.1 MAG: hypothetical protein UV55_C0019G0025 [Candidatus Gottesmanbacteria bacterium GW2011_GWC1_43_10]KKS86901.1 MAG: hypothetical protein UV61_C0006G0102 [Candidatus Gottesmanbacteria bacterium GW2011_GWB1_43_11]OGG08248.1 MAG: hypothetical protein A2699_06635 [Candidatus Go
MGYLTEINTLVKPPKGSINLSQLKVGGIYTFTKDRERTFPLHIAMLLVADDWTFLGYCVAHQIVVKDKKTTITFEVLSLFTPEEQKTYTARFLEAAKKTGEV